jgi:Flp pilus assembly protein TadG
VISWPLLRTLTNRWLRFVWSDDRGAQLVEFAVSLPLLMVFVVGIFDFSNAFTLKEKFTNLARDAARVAASDPTSDLQLSSPPLSVADAFQVVDSYLLANNISDCGIKLANGTSSGLTWTFKVTPTSGSPCGITLTINRGYYFPVTGAALPSVNCTSQSPGTKTAVIATCVSIQYAYPWRFGRVASLLGRTATLPSSISATAVAMNEN